jgi:hypothetical protein
MVPGITFASVTNANSLTSGFLWSVLILLNNTAAWERCRCYAATSRSPLYARDSFLGAVPLDAYCDQTQYLRSADPHGIPRDCPRM